MASSLLQKIAEFHGVPPEEIDDIMELICACGDRYGIHLNYDLGRCCDCNDCVQFQWPDGTSYDPNSDGVSPKPVSSYIDGAW